jgi:hypothetical protein
MAIIVVARFAPLKLRCFDLSDSFELNSAAIVEALPPLFGILHSLVASGTVNPFQVEVSARIGFWRQG